MSDFVTVTKHEPSVSVMFQVEADEVMAIGGKMEAINQQAYMNGYNWAAFLEHYLRSNHPDLADGLESDPEGGAYFAHYELGNEDKAKRFADVINGLVAKPETIYAYLKENGEEIERD